MTISPRGLAEFLQAPCCDADPGLGRDAMTPITYPALYQTVRRWLEKAVSAADLPAMKRPSSARFPPTGCATPSAQG